MEYWNLIIYLIFLYCKVVYCLCWGYKCLDVLIIIIDNFGGEWGVYFDCVLFVMG